MNSENKATPEEELRLEKKRLRRELLAMRDRIPKESKEEKSAEICETLINDEDYLQAKTVFCFIPYHGEVDIMPVVYDAWEKGKIVGAPRIDEDGTMRFYAINSEEDLVSGYKGIREPNTNCPQITAGRPFVITPGSAFTEDGYRMGYGKGFYDRFFAAHDCIAVGVCFDEQFVEYLPLEPTDKRLDRIISA